MKLTTVLLIATIMQVSATGFAQRLTLKENGVTIKQIFKEIKIQTGYDVLYQLGTVQDGKKIDAQFFNTDLKEVLQQCLDGQNLDFTVYETTVVIKQKKPSFPDRVVDALVDIRITGRVLDEKGNGLAGATITVKGTAYNIVSGADGYFTITPPDNEVVLQVSYVGYKTKEIRISGDRTDLVIRLELATAELKEVAVVSTGYQTLPKERATGSFERVDNQLFNRTTGPTVLARLEGTVAGLQFDKRGLPGDAAPGLSQLSIRGLSTLEANRTPLIVLDNIPYEGDVRDINPNDVQDITILKDAAAASIWGVRAGNGVIVITTKKGAYNRPLQVSLNSNITVTDKPDLYDVPQMKPADYIEVEKMLFAQGYYDYTLTDTYLHSPVSPAVEIMDQQRSGTITATTANARLDALGQHDVREDYLKYVYRKGLNRQYALNLNGGSGMINYMVSGGYDQNRFNMVKWDEDRMTLRSELSLKPIKNLELQFGSIFTQSRYNNLAASSQLHYTHNVLPYARLADGEGNPLVVTRDYRASFAADPGDSRLLNWQYRPLEELNTGSNKVKNTSWLMNMGGRYTINDFLSAEVKYQYYKTTGVTRDLQGKDSYYMRNLINLFTQAPGSAVERPIPIGDALSQTTADLTSYTLRGQLNASKSWGTAHQLVAIAGAETRENHEQFNSLITYGYNDRNLTYQRNIDFNTNFPGYTWPFGGGAIPNGLYFGDKTFRFTSLFANAAYTYKNRYTVSASGRKDASNLFGVNANQRGVPLWSAGASWDIAGEPFYKFGLIPVLKIRATYGYNGNTSSSVSAYSVLQYYPTAPYTSQPYAEIKSPANADLRWEKVGVMNLGLDFGFKNNVLSGSIEYYTKAAKDLLSVSPLPLSRGFNFTSTNGVNLESKGIELSLHSTNLSLGSFKWNTDFVLSYAQNKVTRYTPLTEPTSGTYTSASGQAVVPILDKPLFSVYSYKWAGLDPANGDPQGYDAEGKISKDYYTLYLATAEQLQYHGSAIPTRYGNFRNTFSWRNLSVSANITYKLGYYFRKESINYGNLFGYGQGHADYAQRWQNPGDEKTTNVPAVSYPADPYRDLFYAGSSALIGKGDHIRLQDITASYGIDKPNRFFKNARLYATIANLGILWRSNKWGMDPDYGTGYPAAKSVAVGLSANF